MDFQDFLDSKLIPAMNSIGQQRHIQAIRDGMIMNLVPSMIGSLFLLIAALPFPGYGDFIRSIGLFDALVLPIGVTLDLMGITAVIAISYRLAESYKTDPLASAIIALLCFFLLTPYKITHELIQNEITGVIPVIYLGSRGLFSALIVSLISTEIYIKISKADLTIKMPEGVPPAVAKSFAALIPGGITVIIFWLIRLLIDWSPFENIHTILAELVTNPLIGISNSIWGAIGFMFLVHLFWFFGIHGHLVIGSVLDPIFFVLQDQNRLAFQAGQEMPNIVTRYWFDLYVQLGGAGASLPIVILMALWARSSHLKKVGRLSLLPGIFNINEPFVFGIPVVFNPAVIIPWIVAPIINVCIAYSATIIGFLPKHNGIILPWTTPVIINGFIVAGWRGVVIQIINLCVSAIIWYSFMKKLDYIEYQREFEKLKN